MVSFLYQYGWEISYTIGAFIEGLQCSLKPNDGRLKPKMDTVPDNPPPIDSVSNNMNDLIKDFILSISVIKELNYNFVSWKDQLRESNRKEVEDLMNKIRFDILKRREFAEKHFKERVRLADANADSMESRRYALMKRSSGTISTSNVAKVKDVLEVHREYIRLKDQGIQFLRCLDKQIEELSEHCDYFKQVLPYITEDEKDG
ncbi:hypothetical protein OROGR_028968 [Orobanche gracilis]